MEAAKSAISKITGRNGHHTEVDETVLPAVTSEVVKPHRHEETTEAIDKEIHQHHYHTTVQPITHRETAAEKHTHNILPQVNREFKHEHETETRRRVSAELSQFKNSSNTLETKHTTSIAPQMVGEHVHHHVHETVQPVIYKETTKPETVHTTIPIHEVHHEAAKHHDISVLPTKTLNEFSKSGGVLADKVMHTHEHYEGQPKPYNSKLQTTLEKATSNHQENYTKLVDSNTSHSSTVGNGVATSGLINKNHNHINGTVERSGPVVHEEHHRKPTLKEKLDPRIDADRDGKAGIFD